MMFNNWLTDFGVNAFRITFDFMRLLNINLCSLPSENHRDAVTAVALSQAIPEERVTGDLKIAGLQLSKKLLMFYRRSLNLR